MISQPPGHFFVVGDNRDNSSDSRLWGFVGQDLMRGKVLTVWLSMRDGAIDTSRFNVTVR